MCVYVCEKGGNHGKFYDKNKSARLVDVAFYKGRGVGGVSSGTTGVKSLAGKTVCLSSF